MTTYVFDQIDPAHPPRLDLIDNTDQVLFHGGPARLAVVTYAVVNGESVTTVDFGGHAVGFDPGLQIVAAHKDLIFDDGSNLIIGGPRDEAFEGGAGDDGMFGGDGNDTLEGHDGDNFLQGNQGNDRLLAEDGSDTILGGKGDDQIFAGVFSSGLDVFPTEPPAFVEAGNLVNGNLGDDTIAGGSGSDILLGGQGNDVIFGGGSVPGVVSIDRLVGNLGDDHLIADGPATLLGEDGADTLVARAEGAAMVGGAGADLFGFAIPGAEAVTHSSGTILDWSSEDSIAFVNVGSGHAYVEASAADFQSAVMVANGLMHASTDPLRAGGEVAVVQVGEDLFAFVANAGSDDADFAIRILGRTLADVGASDFI